LYSKEWWELVAPDLTPEGRALAHKTLMEAANKLEEAKAAAKRMRDAANFLFIKKKLAGFDRALRGLKTPSPEQKSWLKNRPKLSPEEASTLPLLNLSCILICHPESGEAISWNGCQFPAVTFVGAVFAGKTNFDAANFIANFQNAIFKGSAVFGGAVFAGETGFDWAKFEGGVSFLNTIFTCNAGFVFAKFAEEAGFEKAIFAGEAIFWKAIFASGATFEKAKFAGEANFWEAKFTGEATFSRAHFAGEATFEEANFTGRADFSEAEFTGMANFREATFEKLVYFEAATFTGVANFQQAEFTEKAVFEGASFTGVANFYTARFNKTVAFRGSTWKAVPDFGGTAFKDGMAIADLKNLQSGLTAGTIAWDADPEPTPPSGSLKPAPAAPITDRLQALRKMAHDADDRPRELDYFALELQSRYQAKKKPVAEGDDTSQETEDGNINRHSEQERGWLWLKRQLIALYGLFSDYGRGVLRPICWLLVLWAGCALGYARLAVVWTDVSIREYLATLLSQSSGDALTLSLVNALPALGVASEARKSSLEALYGSVDAVHPAVHVIGVVEGVAAILLLFLIGLGLRNRFRL
jgi:uncharacterized protein YjbI with pentapeptide repeats